MARRAGADRIAGIGTSIFTEITRLAVEHGAVNLGQGFPDFPAPDFVKEAAARHIREDRNQYAASPGIPRLRQALAADWARKHGAAGRTPDPDAEITVASGATELLHDAILATVNPGDEVILLEPAYDAYAPDVLMAGGVPRPVRLLPPGDARDEVWRLDEQALAAAFGPRTRALVLNTPHNPTGKLFTRPELEVVAALCQRHDALVISDEVYSEIVFDGAPHVPIATLPGMFERTITIDSMGKTFSVTGWKVGWAIAPAPLTAALRAVHQFVTFTNAAPFQEALADILPLAAREGYYDRLRADYTRRRAMLLEILRGAGLDPLPIGGAYFLLAPVSEPDDTFCRRLVTEVGVAAIPVSAFYADPATAPRLARFCFAKRDDTLRAAAAPLAGLRAL
jgi:aspartate/methionine/tyrosine aminotransferase